MSGKSKSKTVSGKSAPPRPVRKDAVTFVSKTPSSRPRPQINASLELNPYARVLLNPEFEENLGVPDGYGGRTHKFTTITNYPLPVDASGRFAGIVCPDMENSLWTTNRSSEVYVEILRASTLPTQIGSITIPTDYTDWQGNYLYSNSALAALGQVGAGTTSVLWSAARSEPVAPGSNNQILFLHAIDGVEYIPFTGMGAIVEVIGTLYGATDVSLSFDLVDATGTPIAPVGTAAIVLPVQPALGFQVAVASAGAGECYISRITITSNGGTSAIRSIAISVASASAPDAVVAPYLFEGAPVSDFDVFLRDMVAVRCVGLSALCTYRGPALAGGAIAGMRFQGATAPNFSLAPVQPYARLASRPGAYDGAVNTGNYSFWLPQDVSGVQFTHPQTIRDDFRRGYLAFAGYTTDLTAGNVRVRVASAWEAITYKQVYHLSDSQVHPDHLNAALLTLSDLPASMENDLHWSTIASYLKKGATAVGKELWGQRSKLAQLIGDKAGAPALGQAAGRILSAM